MEKTRTAMQRLAEVASAPTTSAWLKRAIAEALTRDPVDALNDAEHLAALLEARLDAVLDAGRKVTS